VEPGNSGFRWQVSQITVKDPLMTVIAQWTNLTAETTHGLHQLELQLSAEPVQGIHLKTFVNLLIFHLKVESFQVETRRILHFLRYIFSTFIYRCRFLSYFCSRFDFLKIFKQ